MQITKKFTTLRRSVKSIPSIDVSFSHHLVISPPISFVNNRSSYLPWSLNCKNAPPLGSLSCDHVSSAFKGYKTLRMSISLIAKNTITKKLTHSLCNVCCWNQYTAPIFFSLPLAILDTINKTGVETKAVRNNCSSGNFMNETDLSYPYLIKGRKMQVRVVNWNLMERWIVLYLRDLRILKEV